MYTSAIAIMVYNCLCFIRELYNMKQQKWHYLVDPSNLVSWNLYICSTIMILPTLFGGYWDIQVCLNISRSLSDDSVVNTRPGKLLKHY